jgi:hypothetical protein
MRHLPTALLLSSLSLFACGRAAEIDDAEDADEAVSIATTESALSTTLTDDLAQPMSATAEDLAAAAEARVGSRLQPAGCVTSTRAGATVTYVFTNCTGPYGLVKLNGTVVAVYSPKPGGVVQAVVTSTGFKANELTFDLNATVLASETNGVKKADVTVQAEGTGPRGGTVERQGAYVATYDAAAGCVTLDGAWQTKAGLRTSSTVMAGYKRCKGSCPAAGGTITHTGPQRVVTTLSYDGSAVASWSTSSGRSGTLNLRCGR